MQLIYDIESDGLLNEITKIWCIGICDVATGDVQTYTDHDPGYPSLREGLERLKAADRVSGHNCIGFDMPAINKLFPNTLTFSQQWDTMVVAALLEPSRRSLALASFGQQFNFPKGEYNDWTKYSDEMRVYMEQDVALTWVLYKYLQRKLQKLYHEGNDYRPAIQLEHEVQLALSLQAQHGFRFDVAGAETLSVKLTEDISKLESTLSRVFTPMVRPYERPLGL